MAYAVGSAYVGRRLVRTAFQRRNRSDTEDSLRFRCPEIGTKAGGIPWQLQTISRERGCNKMKTFLSEEALVAAYWRRLARSIDKPRARKRRRLSRLKSGVRSAVRQRFAFRQKVKPLFATGGAEG